MNLAFPAAVGGGVDTGWFLLRRPSLLRSAPGRALGSAAFLALWTALAVRTASEDDETTSLTVALAGAALVANAAMLGVHLRHRIAGPRIVLGTVLSAVAFGDSLRRR